MADTLTTQIIQDGGRTAIIRGNVAVGNTDVVTSVIVDVSTLSNDPVTGQVCTSATVQAVTYASTLAFDATTDINIFTLPADWTEQYDFTDFGIPNPGTFGAAGNTGDIVATTISPAAGDAYSFIVTVTKSYASV